MMAIEAKTLPGYGELQLADLLKPQQMKNKTLLRVTAIGPTALVYPDLSV